MCVREQRGRERERERAEREGERGGERVRERHTYLFSEPCEGCRHHDTLSPSIYHAFPTCKHIILYKHNTVDTSKEFNIDIIILPNIMSF